MNEKTKQQGFSQKVLNIYAAPAEAFAAIELAPSWLAPIALVMLSGLAATSYYFSGLDMAWWVDDTLRQANVEEADLEAARAAMGSMTRGMLFSIGATSTVLAGFFNRTRSGDVFEPRRCDHWVCLQIQTLDGPRLVDVAPLRCWHTCHDSERRFAPQRPAKLLRPRSNEPGRARPHTRRHSP